MGRSLGGKDIVAWTNRNVVPAKILSRVFLAETVEGT